MTGALHKLWVAVWGEAPDTQEERKLLRKIDFFILTYCCMAFFFNYLDRAVLANAYVSGMKEDLHFVGNEYNLLVTILSIGYILGQVPNALVIQKVSPRIWFPLMTVVWAGLTMCSAACHNFSQMAAVRFFQGIAEASTYSGTQYIIGSWYKPNETGKRVGLFAASGQAGTMFAGILMTAIWKSLNGHAGLAGWRWVFIICGLVTLPVAAFGFAFFPDLPETTQAFYLLPHERELALARIPPKDPEGHKIDLALVKRVLLGLNFWLFNIFWILGGALEAFSTQTCMVLWMKASGLFTVPENNDYPLGIQAIGIVVTMLTSVGIDATGKIAPFGFVACVTQIMSCIILLCWNFTSTSAKLAAYYLAGIAYMIQPVVFTWATRVLSRNGDDAGRAVVLYSMNGASSVLFSFWGIVLYPTTDAATGFHKGTITMVVVSVLLGVCIGIVWWRDSATVLEGQSLSVQQDKLSEAELGVVNVHVPHKSAGSKV